MSGTYDSATTGSRDGGGGVQSVMEIDVRCHKCGAHRVAEYVLILAPLEDEKER